jgi:hypothetical protein
MHLIIDKEKVIKKYLMSNPEILDVKFTEYYVDILTCEPRNEGIGSPWWRHYGSIDSLYKTASIDTENQ